MIIKFLFKNLPKLRTNIRKEFKTRQGFDLFDVGSEIPPRSVQSNVLTIRHIDGNDPRIFCDAVNIVCADGKDKRDLPGISRNDNATAGNRHRRAAGRDAAKITPVFVSVDPERDTPKIIGEYVANFDPRFVGLTGTPEQLAHMARVFHVYYKKIANEKDAQNYGMDHPSILYLMGPDGKFAKHFPYSTDAKKLALELKSVLEG